MKRKFALTLATAVLSTSLLGSGFAAVYPESTQYANELKTLGIIKGSEKGFEFSRRPTRAEISIMLVNLLGDEKGLKENTQKHPFKDVPTWADPAVNYLYAKGLSSGIDANTFGANNLASVYDYTTFVLKSLGYSADDFTYKGSLDFAASIGLITTGEKETLLSKTFTREDMILLTYKAIHSKKKDGSVLSEDVKTYRKVKHETFTTTFTNEDFNNKVTFENPVYDISFGNQGTLNTIKFIVKPHLNDYAGKDFVIKTTIDGNGEPQKTNFKFLINFNPTMHMYNRLETAFTLLPENKVTVEVIDVEDLYKASSHIVAADAPITIMPFGELDTLKEKLFNAPGHYISNKSSVAFKYEKPSGNNMNLYEMVLKLTYSKDRNLSPGWPYIRSKFNENPSIEILPPKSSYTTKSSENIIKIVEPSEDDCPVIILLNAQLEPVEYIILR